MSRRTAGSLTAMLVSALMLFCGERATPPEPPVAPIERDLNAIREEGTIRALMTFDSTSYFLYRGEPMGFEYELLRKFAEDHDLKLEVTVFRSRSQLWNQLNRGDGDVAASRLFASEAEKRTVRYTRPIRHVQPALVQQSGAAAGELPDIAAESLQVPAGSVQLSARRVQRPEQLAGRLVHLPEKSRLEPALMEISDRITGDVEIVEVKGVASVEPLIRQVMRGEIELTAAAEDVAKLSTEYFDNVTVEPALGPPLELVWAVRTSASQLAAQLDQWIGANGDAVELLYRKYFRDRRGYRERITDEYLTSETGRLSPYDDLLRTNAPAIGWDWRLLASQAYQESRFDPDARSWAGAVGLLQLMPGTAREVGVGNARDPRQNVEGAVRYLQKLQKSWSSQIADEEERQKFILASYNVGRGHVLDAQRLAERNGQDPKVWENVAYWLLQKSKRSVYTDPIVRHGYCRGLEPVTYVELILERYAHYQEFVKG